MQKGEWGVEKKTKWKEQRKEKVENRIGWEG